MHKIFYVFKILDETSLACFRLLFHIYAGTAAFLCYSSSEICMYVYCICVLYI